jgi:threonine dehydrogenase-like Zn-dependent dehydrogenase
MRAVTFDVTIPRFLLAKSVGRISDSAFYGGLSGVSLGRVHAPELPGDHWVRMDVLKAGICGTDIGNLTYSASPAMEPFGSFPAILGHEILARVTEVGPGVGDLEVGERVTVDPMIHCQVRGYGADSWCRSCRAGYNSTCENAGEEGPLSMGGAPFAPGLTQGYHRSLGGGFADQVMAHRSQIFRVDDALRDEAGVLIEPLAVGMHAALNAPPADPSEPVLVLGSGPIALATIWSVRAAGFTGEIFAQVKREKEAELAGLMGATRVIRPGDEARSALIETGAHAYMPIVGDEVYSGGGFPLIYDCVGSGQTLSQAMRYASPRGRIVMLGCAAEIPRLDLTFIWSRELEVKGFVGYGMEEFRGERRHTFEITHDLLLETGTPVQELVTHVFPLKDYRQALQTAGNRRKTGSVKVLLDPTVG